MDKQLLFIAEIFFVSTLFALLIKYIIPFFAITPTINNTLISISLPSILLGILFLKRFSQDKNKK